MSSWKPHPALLRFFLISLLTIASSLTAFAEVTITDIDIDITGNTHAGILLEHLQIREGKTFPSYEELVNNVDYRAKLLVNRRIFKEMEWSVNSTSDDTAEIIIRVVDAFSFFPRPMLSYSSLTGPLAGLRFEYYNAFGTLTDVEAISYISAYEAIGRIDVKNIAAGPVLFDTTFEQFYGSTRYGSPDGTLEVEFKNIHSLFNVLASIPFSRKSKWYYDIQPEIIGQYSFEWITHSSGNPDSDYINEGFAWGINHGIHTDQIDWEKNMRRGFQFSLMNENLWYTKTSRSDIFVETDIFGYIPLTTWFELSGRVGGFYAFSGTRKNAGDRLRGVVDYMTFGNMGIFATAQTNFRITPASWGLEVQLRPFVDVGYVYSDEWNHGAESWEYCLGTTTIVYLRKLPSLTLNLEFGWDFKRSMPEFIFDSKLLM